MITDTRRILLSLLCLLVTAAAASAQFSFRGYSGGMFLHSGYLSSDHFSITDGGIAVGSTRISGAAFGIGGALKCNFGTERDMLRIGMEGYSSTVNYSPSPSYFRMGWGGIIVDYIRESKGRINPFIGVTVGGGGAKNHIMIESDNEDFEKETISSFRRYSFMTIAPFLGMEIEATEKLRVVIKADYLLPLPDSRPDFAKGVRLYVGIIFNRLRTPNNN